MKEVILLDYPTHLTISKVRIQLSQLNYVIIGIKLKLMKKMKFILPIVILGLTLASCGNVCIRCENGATGDQETECFTNKDERQEYVIVKELAGYTCNEK